MLVIRKSLKKEGMWTASSLGGREGGEGARLRRGREGDGGEHGITLPSAVAGGQVYAGEPQVVTHSAPALQRSPYSHLYRVEGGEPDRL